MYVVFPFGKNQALKAVLVNRALELGYKTHTDQEIFSHDISLNPDSGDLHWWGLVENSNPSDFPPGKTLSRSSVIGDLFDLLFTDKYKPIKRPAKVKLNDEYTAEITDKEVKVGCQTFSVEKLQEILDIAKRWKR